MAHHFSKYTRRFYSEKSAEIKSRCYCRGQVHARQAALAMKRYHSWMICLVVLGVFSVGVVRKPVFAQWGRSYGSYPDGAPRVYTASGTPRIEEASGVSTPDAQQNLKPQTEALISHIEYRERPSHAWRKVPVPGEKGFPLIVPRRGGTREFRAVLRNAREKSSPYWPLWRIRILSLKKLSSQMKSGIVTQWKAPSHDGNMNFLPFAQGVPEIEEEGVWETVSRIGTKFHVEAYAKNKVQAQIQIGPDKFEKDDPQYQRQIELSRDWKLLAKTLEHTSLSWGVNEEMAKDALSISSSSQFPTYYALESSYYSHGTSPPYVNFPPGPSAQVRFRAAGDALVFNEKGAEDDVADMRDSDSAKIQFAAPTRPGTVEVFADLISPFGEVIRTDKAKIVFRRPTYAVIVGEWELSPNVALKTAHAGGAPVFQRRIRVEGRLPQGKNGWKSASPSNVPIEIWDLTQGRPADSQRSWLSDDRVPTNSFPSESHTTQYFRADPEMNSTRQMSAYVVRVKGAQMEAQVGR